jgi:predicted TIM-barrel fold metal-dependent hydrolase
MGDRVRAIDGWATLITPEKSDLWPDSFWHIFKRYGVDDIFRAGKTAEQVLEEMDEAEMGRIILSAFVFDGQEMCSNTEAGELSVKHPDRFTMACTVDPRDGMKAYDEVKRCVEEYDCRALRLEPYAYGNGKTGLPPNDKLYFPLYAKCCELDLAVVTQVGHTGPLLPSEAGRPIYLDEVALSFPELRIAGAHLGQPWHEEMMILAWKHPNVYVETSARPPKHWPESFNKFVKSYGQDKVLWATDYPILPFKECLAEVDDLGLDLDIKTKLLRDNALTFFRLDD